jgi:hypothetical protein
MAFRSPWKNKTSIAIALFIALMVWMFWQEAQADTSVELSAGSLTFVGGEQYDSETLTFNETWDEGKYLIGIALQLRLDCREGSECERGADDSNQIIYFQRLVHYKKFELGFGAAYFHNEPPAFSSHTPYVLSLAWNLDEHWAVNYKHFSTGGASSNNGGLDMLAIRYSF